MQELRAVEVKMLGKRVGAVAPMKDYPGYYEFQFAPSFIKEGLSPSPLKMPLSTRRFGFPSLSQETFKGLPGMIADALPDKFGNALIDEFMSRKGWTKEDITPLQRLLYVGRRALGALEFEPAKEDDRNVLAAAPLEMAGLVEDARRALKGEFGSIAQTMMDIGSSAGGARAKAVVGWNPETKEVTSGQFDLPDGFEHWLLKFDVGADGELGLSAGFGRIEFAHYLMAKEAGIEMSDCRLLEENGRAHFMTKRFDRNGNEKVHVQTFCGLTHADFNMPRHYGYEQYLRAVLGLKIGAKALEQAWMRCVFNVAICNCDDHPKNLSFMMDRTGKWSLSPAYDACFSHNPNVGKWTSSHQMLVGGKSWDITESDLLDLAAQFDVRHAKENLERIKDAVSRWKTFASEAGVPDEDADRVASFHPFTDAKPKPPVRGNGLRKESLKR